MKVFPFKIPKASKDALITQVDREFYFYDKLHQHQEVQVTYIYKGTGTLVVGDAVHRFNPGHIYIFGSNLPHVFKSDTPTDELSHKFTIFFREDAFGTHFFETEELKAVLTLFKGALSGYRVIDYNATYNTLFTKIKKASKLRRFILFIQLLEKFLDEKKEVLSNFKDARHYGLTEGKRMSQIFDFTMNHFKQDISLEKIAQIAAMSPTAFCRFFKERTNKTYTHFLLEIRIEHACQLLTKNSYTHIPIADIAFESGFRSVSNFNRYFKKIKGCSPTLYKKETMVKS